MMPPSELMTDDEWSAFESVTLADVRPPRALVFGEVR